MSLNTTIFVLTNTFYQIKKSTMKKLCLFLSLISLLALTACSDDNPNVETTLLDDTDVNIHIAEFKNDIVITIEMLEDITNDLFDENIPDFCVFYIDANNNNQIDANIDFGYASSSTGGFEICSFIMLENFANTPCGDLESEATLDNGFRTSSLNEAAHVIWTLTIPKDELDESNQLNFTLRTVSDGVSEYYPKNSTYDSVSFANTFTFEW